MRSNWPFDVGFFRGVGWVGDRDSIWGVSLVDKFVVKRYQGLYIYHLKGFRLAKGARHNSWPLTRYPSVEASSTGDLRHDVVPEAR